MLGGPLRAVARREARRAMRAVAERLRARRAAAAERDRAIGLDLEPVAVGIDDLGRLRECMTRSEWISTSNEHARALDLADVREDGEEVTFTMPDFVEQGDELGEIALLVIRARQRWRELKGLGG